MPNIDYKVYDPMASLEIMHNIDNIIDSAQEN